MKVVMNNVILILIAFTSNQMLVGMPPVPDDLANVANLRIKEVQRDKTVSLVANINIKETSKGIFLSALIQNYSKKSITYDKSKLNDPYFMVSILSEDGSMIAQRVHPLKYPKKNIAIGPGETKMVNYRLDGFYLRPGVSYKISLSAIPSNSVKVVCEQKKNAMSSEERNIKQNQGLEEIFWNPEK